MSVSISKWGNSAAIRLPKNVLEALSLGIGDSVNLVQREGMVIIEPCKPSLDELLNQVTPENKHQEMISDSQGKELL